MHYFGDQQIATDSKIIANGVDYVEEAIRKDLHEVGNEIIVKILGVIRFVAKRRTKYGREYMHIIHQYVGQRIDTGIRILRQWIAITIASSCKGKSEKCNTPWQIMYHDKKSED